MKRPSTSNKKTTTLTKECLITTPMMKATKGIFKPFEIDGKITSSSYYYKKKMECFFLYFNSLL